MCDEERMEFFCKAQCKNLSDAQLKETVVSLLKESRVAHVLGCAQTAVELARKWGADEADAYRAGILHDVTKALDGASQQELCQKLGLTPEAFQWENPKTLHQLTGSVVARQVFGENEVVCQAIKTHTTGCAGMNTLQKIIYIADYMEPNRDFEGVEQMRRLAFTHLDSAVVMGLEMTVALLQQQGKHVCPATKAALEDLKKENITC